jgi:hypothetical protein
MKASITYSKIITAVYENYVTTHKVGELKNVLSGLSEFTMVVSKTRLKKALRACEGFNVEVDESWGNEWEVRITANKNFLGENYKGFRIVKSDRLEGWFMTECRTICGECIDEVKYDIDNTQRAIDFNNNILIKTI